MPEIKLSHIVSFSSEDKHFPADNLVHEGNVKKWRCEPGEKQAHVIIQLEKACKIHQIDIGNDGSAFVEVLAGRSGTSDTDYQVILVASSFMNPLESRSGQNCSSVRCFSTDKLCKEVSEQKWDRVKVVCSQPFNKTARYGLAFIKLSSPPDDEETKECQKTVAQLGVFKMKDDEDDPILTGSLFAAHRHVETTPLLGAAAIREASRQTEEKLTGRTQALKRKQSDAIQTESSVPKVHTGIESTSTDMAGGEPHGSKKPDKKQNITTTKEGNTKSAKKNAPSDVDSTRTTKSKKSVKGQQLSKVVFVLSGFENPYRGELRAKAIELGAQYRGDWDKNCTHLICAFANTPKYNQVKGKGKIVSKDWINDCHKMAKLLPWRKYRLGNAPSPQGSSDDDSSSDEDQDVKDAEDDKYSGNTDEENTDDEIQRALGNSHSTEPTAFSKADAQIYDLSTDEEAEDDQTKSSKGTLDSSTDLIELPDLFSSQHFFIFGTFSSEERREIKRMIIAYDGDVEEYMSPNIKYVITNDEWDDRFDEASSQHEQILFVKPQWLQECHNQQMFVALDKYIIESN